MVAQIQIGMVWWIAKINVQMMLVPQKLADVQMLMEMGFWMLWIIAQM